MCSLAFSQNGRIPLTPSATKSGSLQSNSMSGFSTTFSFNSIESEAISNEKGTFSEIYIDGSFPYGEVGSPSLPMVTRLIAIPEGATPVVTVNGYSENEYALSDYDINTLSAQQAPVRKDIDPTTVEYVVNNAAYARDTYTTDEIASVEYLGTMRGIRIGKLIVRPVAYNAAANTVKVYNDINVTVDFENANAGLTQSMFASTYSPAFNSIYDQLLNKSIFGQSTIKGVYDDHPDLYNTPVRMLVICYSGFRGNSALNQWLAWKLQKGYYVDIFYTDETGTTASAIASFIRTKYNASVAAGNAYSYLITIGDTGQIPQYGQTNIDSSVGNCAYDLGYSSIDFASNSSDYFPDMFYSRISVENTTHLANYIDKVLTYEKFQMPDGGNYLNNVILVGGYDQSWTSTVAQPTINYGSTNYFNSSNTTYGGFENGNIEATVSTNNTAGYAGSATGTSTTMGNGVYTHINTGVGFLNYTAHGDKQEWYQPKMTAKQVANLTNTDKYFFGVGNCCLTGNFNNTTTTYSPGSDIGTNACFAETMIRVPKAGAVAYVGCSPYSYWYEDFYWAVGAHRFSSGNAPSTSASTMGVYDAMFVDDYWNSASSLLYLGNLAVASAFSSNYSNSNSSMDNETPPSYYFKYYHTFGDGSVMPYVTKPEVNNVTHPESVISGATSLTVNAVAGSYVAVTDNESTIYGVAVANTSGVATVNFTEAIPATGTLYVVVTRQQYQPYFGTVAVIAPNPPTADFTGTPTTILERESVTFTNNSQYAATYLWNFGDGQTSTEADPVHTYMTPGTYTVTLRVENTLGNDTKTRTNYITVNANTNPPIADFEASETEISTGTTITFTDLTENIVTSWSWIFEGGTPATSTEQNPTVTYDEPGDYTVTLVATNAYGSNTETKVDYITVLYPEINMSNEELHTCGGIYRDPGGTGNYGNNANYTQTIYPSTDGAMVRLTFNTFALQASSNYYGCRDKLYIYDGTSTSANVLVNGVCGTSNPGTVTATNADGALTIVFTSNNSTTAAGWEAEISCYVPDAEVAVQSYTPTTANYNTTNDLNVTFINNGGLSTGANTTATLSTTDEYLTLNTTTATLGTMARNATANGTFNFTMAENVPDGHVATINVAITDGSNSWNGTLTITAVGPACDAPTGLQVAVDGTSATITWDAYTVVNNTISDDFEGLTHGTINPAGTIGWTYIDGDNTASANFNTISFTNEGSKMAFIALDVNQVEVTSTDVTITAHSGNMILGSPYISSRVTNNDWIISPELNFSQSFTFSFFARGAHTSYSGEQFYVAYSTTGNSASDFINLSELTTTTTTWTQYSYNVPANAKYVAIHYVSRDVFMLSIDDITISEIIESGSEFVNIYDNGVLIASNVTTGTYTANNLSDGEHCFSIRAVCDDDSESLAAQSWVTINSNIPSYTVTVNANNGGTVNPSGAQTVSEGRNFTFSVTPNDCYEIASVTVDGNNVNLTNNQYTISNVTANHTVNVTFSQISYTIAATAGNGGTITGAPASVNCGEGYTFTVTPNDCYEVASVTVNGTPVTTVNNVYTVSNVTATQNINATFNQMTYTITASAGNGGTINNAPSTVNCGGEYTFTVTPESCYEVASVTVNGTPVTPVNNVYTISNVTASQNIAATFNQISYAITTSASNGTIQAPSTVNCGGEYTFTVTPETCYEVASVTVNGTPVTPINNVYTVSNVTAQQNIIATFSQISYAITASAGNGGTINNAPSTVNCGGEYTFTVTPNDCYEVASVTVNGTPVTPVNNVYTISNVTASQNIAATFSQISYAITTSASNGTIEAPSTVNCGEGYTFTVTPETCYELVSVMVNGATVTPTNNVYTVSNVTAQQNIIATFNQLSYTITATAGNGGTINPGTTTVNCGGSQTYTIVPNEGYMISDVTVDGQSVGSVSSYSFTNVIADHTILATFVEIPDNHIVITVNADAEGGSVSPNGSQSVEQGEDFTFTVTPDACYTIGSVTVNGVAVDLDANNSYTIPDVTTEQTVNVTFNQITYNVIANASNGGTIDAASSANCGEDFTFSVTPETCYEIESVTANGIALTAGANNLYTINNVTAEQTITVTFNRTSYTITATAGNGGTITPAGDVEVNCGESMTFAIAASEGYQIADVVVDGQSRGVITSYTFDNVTENGHSISATFEAIPANVIEIIVNADAEGGSVSPAGTQTVTEGGDFTFTVTPDACYTIGIVTVNGTPVELDANNSYTISNVTTEQTINVTFNQIVYTIAASAENGGTITPAGDVEVNCGEDAVFTITPDEGYDIADVIVDGQSAINDIASYSVIGASASYTFNNVTENGHSIVATFRQIAVEECNTVTDLEVSVEPYGNLISWTAAENAVSYNIFRNDEETALANISTTSYVDMNGQSGDTYYIVTVCQYGQSDPSESVQAIQTGIDGSNISVEIYPNPASDKFMIECEGMTTIEIFNVVGQSMGMIDVNSNAISVESSTWTSGVYNVRITTENAGTIVKQIIKQ